MSAIHPDLHEETPATVYGAASFAIGAVEGSRTSSAPTFCASELGKKGWRGSDPRGLYTGRHVYTRRRC